MSFRFCSTVCALTALLLGLAGIAALAAPAAIELKNGQKLEAEIVGYVNGQFEVRDKEGKVSTIPPADVAVVRFNEPAPPPQPEKGPRPGRDARAPAPARELTAEDVQRRAEEHRFSLIYLVFQANLAKNGPAHVAQIEKELGERLARTDLSRESRRDISFAQIIARAALGRTKEANDVMAKLLADYPADPLVKKFDSDRQRGFPRAPDGAPTTTVPPAKTEK